MRATHAAIYIVNTCLENNISISYNKLQKLLYLCQGLHLKKYNVPLCPEDVYKWSYGGGIKEVYHYFNKKTSIKNWKTFHNNIINDFYYVDLILSKSINKEIDILSFEKETINQVLNTFGSFDFFELLYLHKQGDILENINIGTIINNNLIKKNYIYIENYIKNNLKNTLEFSNNIKQLKLGIIESPNNN